MAKAIRRYYEREVEKVLSDQPIDQPIDPTDHNKRVYFCVLKALRESEVKMKQLYVTDSHIHPGNIYIRLEAHRKCVDIIQEYLELAGYELIDRTIDKGIKGFGTLMFWVKIPS